MRLKSAYEDFEANTLGLVHGLLARFSYVGSLHDGEGNYEHWGMAKVYGEGAAQRTLRTSHRQLLSEILKKPLSRLVQEMPSVGANDLTQQDFLAELARSSTSPKPLSASAQAHLESVLIALSALVESQRDANPPGASQPPPPARGSQPPEDT